MTEEWVKWKPLPDLSNSYYIDEILDRIKNFNFLLTDYNDERKKLRVIFEHSVDAYRSTDESYRQKTLYDLGNKHGTEFTKWTFFKVYNSSYIQWLSEDSYEFLDKDSFTHFCFIAADSILDVVTNYEPRFESFVE